MKVFPKMRPDKISVIAQNDSLICAFGSRYIKVHRESHFVDVASRKMRELARLLIAIRVINKSVKSLMDLLQPKYYDILIEATKIVANYDKTKECFKSPTFAMNISTTLKQCCDLALVFALKRKDIYSTVSVAEAEAAIKTMSQLISANWKYDISTEAANNLSTNKWNKITIVPLATDLKKLKDYLTMKSKLAKDKILEDINNKEAYRILLETVYCRVILLNRRRPGELQRLLLETYEKCIQNEGQHYEEFFDVVSPTEKILLKRFRRVVIPGKRHRGVPVLFSIDVQEDITILLKARPNVVDQTNKYLFAPPHSQHHIVGYKILAKYAKSSGAERYDALTSTRLRKHLATLSQIFNMTESDLEQLSSFMGHTPGTHKNFYRLPQDVYQSSKVAKILLLMEQGLAANFKGKSIDEIDINLEDDLGNETAIEDDFPEIEPQSMLEETELENDVNKEPNSEENTKDQKNLTSRNPIIRIKWTEHQKKIVSKFFVNHIRNKKPPKRHECEELIKANPEILANKNWTKIKVFVQNLYCKKC
ncbi:uncharacterized protein LOC126883959 [Diabrotica virgifera virgifera]|uniref:Uncharacterized protein n=1 Tax=Diabrotica virgifera virgifera TaxID=50390 RepID=A0ABM5K672_DIAVI|nr:uncharacterized protein LOC126883959 [Diabrotica virgifera virgifera]